MEAAFTCCRLGAPHLIEVMYIGLSLELLKGPVLAQRPRIHLFVGCDDVNALLHPLQIVLSWHFTGSCIHNDCVGHIVPGHVLSKLVQVS